MLIIQKTTEIKLEKKSAVAIGKFDGIHLGHRKLIDRILEQKKDGTLAVIFTFEPSPETFFRGMEMKGLMTKEEKRLAFENMGIDVLIEFPLNRETAAISPERFITEYLVGKINAAFIAAGTDLSFGDKGAGDAGLLKRLSEANGYRVDIIDKVTFEGKQISSTLIREAVRDGNMENVEALMGEPYQIKGVVSHGRRLGRQLKMPTANIIPPETKLLPPAGVYYSYVWLDAVRYNAISNIGFKPTVSDDKVMGVETYIYDFNKDIYGKELTVEFLGFKRPEKKFDGLEALKAQIRTDIDDGRKYHKLRLVI